jgi:hypothetical protein
MQNETNITMGPTYLLYLFESSRIYKVGIIASPYASIEWPCVQTPQALSAILQDRGINISLLNNEGEHQHAPIYFYERNPTGRGLDFNDFPEKKADFLRYAVQLNCINPIRDITKSPLPSLEEIARGISIHLRDVIKPGSQSKWDLDTALTN